MFIYANGKQISGSGTITYFRHGDALRLECRYSCAIATGGTGIPTLQEVVGNTLVDLPTTESQCNGRTSGSLFYAINSSSAKGQHTYKCWFSQVPNSALYSANATLSFEGESNGAVPSTEMYQSS